MITVIIAGGSGTRLWPLSTSAYPKHLLRLTGERSLVQMAYYRAKRLGDIVYVVTEASHADHIREQLSDLPDDAFLIEPGRRGTAHALVYALDVIVRRHGKDEPIAFTHADHHIRDVEGFARSFAAAAEVSQDKNTITLIGVEPTHPTTVLGYIERDGAIDEARGIYWVDSFKEKPDYETAQRYLATGRYLWNCGYFVGTAKTFLGQMKQFAPDLIESYEALVEAGEPGSGKYNETYLALENKVIDTALIEKTHGLAVVAASFDWLDVGSFRDLHGAVPKDEHGNYVYGENVFPIDVENVYIRNEETKPVAVIGLDNIVVVNTPEGILVVRKDISQRAGEVAKELLKRQD
ncbi:MAG TPA: sugar phosphate nucleotidyltransferase [Candidatus Saccharimonadales bacterium]